MKLSEIKNGQEVKIVNLYGEPIIKHRLLEMGLVPNTIIKIVKIAPLGDPIEILLRGYEFTLRKDEAEKIEVKVVE